MKGKHSDNIGETYKMIMQKKGITVPPSDVPRPMTANPVTKQDPGLGGTTLSHPFKAGKPKI